jgi:tellurite resistance protein TerC
MNSTTYSFWAWAGFAVFILIMLTIDLGLFNRKAKVTTYKNAAIWSVVWISLALLFGVGVFYKLGSEKGWLFLTGYIVELSLSVDNLFVFLMIFSYFKVPEKYQHRVLFWGVLGALVMRATMILVGVGLINRFHWILYVFGAFLIYTGIKMFTQKENELEPEDNPMVKLVTRFVPIARHYEGEKFFTRIDGRLSGTLLLLVLVLVEFTDLVFAVDSIPAILGITTDPFIVYTSNVFAILGLRTFYFLLAGVVERLHYLKVGLAAVLIFIGIKMIIEILHIKISPPISLSIIGTILGLSVIASIIWPQRAETHMVIDMPPEFDSPWDNEERKKVEETKG